MARDEAVAATGFGYHVRIQDDEGAIVARHPITSALYCFRCSVSGRQPCAHIDAVLSFLHYKEL